MQDWLDKLIPQIIPVGMNLIAAVIFLLVGRWIALFLAGMLRKMIIKAHPDETLASFLSNIAYAAMLVAVLIGTVDTLGFKVTSLLAIFGAAGLAVGLALQGSLSNFASGVMLIIFRPFAAGHFVEVAGVSGIVEHIRIFNTIVRTGDNREIIIPNSQIFGETITNYSARDTRRIDMIIGISYDDDIDRAKELIAGVMRAEARVLEDPAPVIMVLELADSSVNIAVRPWVKTPDYWATRGDLLHQIKVALEGAGLSIPYPQRDVHMFEEKAA